MTRIFKLRDSPDVEGLSTAPIKLLEVEIDTAPSGIMSFTLLTALLLIVAFGFGVQSLFTDSTVYAPGFSEAKFRSIGVGMSRDDVIRALGKPLSVKPAPGYLLWIYAAPDYRHPRPPGNGPSVIPAETSFQADLAGKIIEVSGVYLDIKKTDFLGRTLADVKKEFGDPLETCSAPERELYLYTKMDGIKGHYTRLISISSQGIVSEIAAGRIGYYTGVAQKRAMDWLEWLEASL